MPDRRAFCQGIALAGLGAWLAGCSRGPSEPRLLGAADLGQAERLYGMAPAEGDIRYQPDVVMVRGGASSILGRGDDGLTWVIDAGARGASRLQPGAVALVTDRCAGRVLAMRRSGDAVVLLLGPAGLTDYIRDCDLALEQPMDLARAVVEVAPGLPGTGMNLSPVAPWRDRDADEELARAEAFEALQAGGQAWPAAAGRLPLRIAVIPEVGAGGIGIRTALSNSQTNIEFVAKLRLQAPRVHLRLRIGVGKLKEASLRLSGAAGLRLGFIATTEGKVDANINTLGRLVPVAMTLPILLNIGSPLSLSLHQRFMVKSAFSASNSVLKAIGDYGLQGDLHFGYRDGHFGQFGGPVIQTVNSGMVQGLRGISVGVSGMVLAHQLRVLAGIGGFGFRVGPYMAMTSSVGVSRGSNLALPLQPNVCRAATLAIHVAPGIGWQVPQLIADGVNAILGLLRVRKIESSGGVHSEGKHVLKRTAYAPDTPLCREAAGGGPAGQQSGGGRRGVGPPPSSPTSPQPASPAPSSPADTRSLPPLDLDRACNDPKLRDQLQQAGLDMGKACRGIGQPT
jgi:hypothetical protein